MGRGNLWGAFPTLSSIGGGGAGFGVAKMLTDKGIDIVIAGKFGESMIGALESRGLRYYEMAGNPRQAVLKAMKK